MEILKYSVFDTGLIWGRHEDTALFKKREEVQEL